MKTSVIFAIIRKDVLGLLPLILLAFVVYFVQPVIAALDLRGAADFWLTLQANFYWLGYCLGLLLLISVLQLDPASSLNHDWLTRPVGRLDWLLAKLGFLLLTVYLPTVLARFVLNLGNDYGLARTFGYALAIENSAALLPVPLVFAVALLTPTLRRFLLVCVLIFMVFLGPAWDVSRPLFDLLGVDLGADYDGMMWLQALPMIVWGVGGVMLVYWFRYARRRPVAAWLVLAACVGLYFFTAFAPRPLYDWGDAIAIHRAMINRDGEHLEQAVVLDRDSACFPAALVGDLASDPVLSRAGLYEDIIARAGPGAMVFATPVSNREILVDWFESAQAGREIPVDWAVDHLRVRGRFQADSLDNEVELIPANRAVNRYDPLSSADTHFWLIPGDAVATLVGDPSTRLSLDFDLGLLAPVAYELPTDGTRYEFPRLGSCRAELDRNANRVEVDCVKVGPQPALVATQLIGIDSSRVFSPYRPNYKADWLEAIGRRHYRMTIDDPSLVSHDAVMVTAYSPSRILHRQIIVDGLLGDSPAICPPPGSQRLAAIERSSWSDQSPHETSSIAVTPDVRVEVLDWRRGDRPEAPTLLLLHGLGATAHSYDELALKLAGRYNVVAMTRRGVGASSRPNHGYDIERLSRDVLAVMNTLELERPILIGHSIAGEELNYLGAQEGERFAGLIYLDAAYDRSARANRRYRELSASLPQAPPMQPAEAVSYQAFTDYSRRIGRSRTIPEGEILASYDLTSGALKHSMRYLDAVMMGLQPPDYPGISIPALALYALPGSPDVLMEPWYDRDDPRVQSTVRELFELEQQMKRAQLARFDEQVPDSTVLAIENANHWIFVSHEQEVLNAIDRFLEDLGF